MVELFPPNCARLCPFLPERPCAKRASCLPRKLAPECERHEHMKTHVTERIVKATEPPAERETRVFDDEVIGFGFCVYSSNAKAFFLRYGIAGRRRCLTIGSWPDWSVTAARELAPPPSGSSRDAAKDGRAGVG
jgi:hypothetical protein